MPAKTPLSSKYLPEPNSGCWLWMGCYSKDSDYGYVRGSDGKMTQSHRAVYAAHKGLIPEGAHLDHKCRNHACVNPDHLEPMTCADNLRRGDNTVLNYADVAAIRSRAVSGEQQRALASEYMVSESQVSMVVNHKRWKETA